MKTAVDWLIEQLTPSISLQQKHIDELKEKAKEMEKFQIVDARVFYFQELDKTPYGMEYLSKLDGAIGDAEDYYNKTYPGGNPKSFIDGINNFKIKHGAIFENKSYMELKEDDEKEALLTDFLNWYIKRYTDDAKDDIQYFTDATGLQIPIGMIIEHYLTRKEDLI